MRFHVGLQSWNIGGCMLKWTGPLTTFNWQFYLLLFDCFNMVEHMRHTLDIAGTIGINMPMSIMPILSFGFPLFWSIIKHLEKWDKVVNWMLSMALLNWAYNQRCFSSVNIYNQFTLMNWAYSHRCFSFVNLHNQVFFLVKALHRPCNSTWSSYMAAGNLTQVWRISGAAGRPHDRFLR